MTCLKIPVFVFCFLIPGIATYQIRLVGDASNRTGRFEIFYQGEWCTVNPPYMNDANAKVICRMLGYESSGVAVSMLSGRKPGIYGYGTGKVISYDFNCDGTEQHIYECAYGNRSWTTSPANTYPAAAITCEGSLLRLVDGDTKSSGRVEVYVKGGWHTICDSNFDSDDAAVVCRMLGFEANGIAIPFKVSRYGQGFGDSAVTELACNGYESDIKLCKGNWISTCNHVADAGVKCGDLNEFTETPIRLVNGPDYSAGRVEIKFAGKWGTMCASYSSQTNDHHTTMVICNMLGYNNTGAFAYKTAFYGEGDGHAIATWPTCDGSEADIAKCLNIKFGTTSSSCSHSHDVGVNCEGSAEMYGQPKALQIIAEKRFNTNQRWKSMTYPVHPLFIDDTAQETQMRLQDGVSEQSGRVEVFHNGHWGTVGSTNFDRHDLKVICKMMGFNYSLNSFFYRHSFYGQGHGEVVFSHLACTGIEEDIGQCDTLSWPSTQSEGHTQDVGVNCDGKTQMRLQDGVSEQSGRVEVFHNGHWGTVGSEYFDHHDLKVICKMMGYNYSLNSFFYRHSFYGQGHGEVVFSRLGCTGIEDDIGQCDTLSWPSTQSEGHTQDVGVNCDGNIPIRLVGGTSNATGRVEILHNGRFGTICDYRFDRNDLIVLCRMLGFENIPATAYWHTNAYFGRGLGEIVVSSMDCNGAENSIGTCSASWPASSRYCTHADDVAISCDGTREPLRLVGGPSNYSGRVEVLHNGEWGRICASSFGREDAVVLCRMLGFPNPESAIAYTRSKYGVGNGTVVVTNLQCLGLEDTLEECNAHWLPSSCSSSYGDVGVDCCPSCTVTQIVG